MMQAASDHHQPFIIYIFTFGSNLVIPQRSNSIKMRSRFVFGVVRGAQGWLKDVNAIAPNRRLEQSTFFGAFILVDPLGPSGNCKGPMPEEL
jgi:hypothetical protein